jgi:hypothetical protein
MQPMWLLLHLPMSKPRMATSIVIFGFLFSQFTKDNETQVGFLKDLMVFVIKSYLLLKTTESIWF